MWLDVLCCLCVSLVVFVFLFFFFSSRRRHTRCYRDWSSDVCSSDLVSLVIGSRRPRQNNMTKSARRLERPSSLATEAVLVLVVEIGRASCRERVSITVVAGAIKRRT